MRVYGPVPSRRFGLSLGIDVIPMKSCTFDCIYCQLGASGRRVGERRLFYPVDDILTDVKKALNTGPRPDVLTLAGSGEPTLYTGLDAVIDGLRDLADIPILLITNSSLLWMDEVADAVKKVDIIAPSLDAGDETKYRRINRPLPEFSFEKMFDGLKRVTDDHPGEIHLEVMLIDGINDDEESLQAIARRLAQLRFHRIDINTPVRPPMPERGAMPCSTEVLARAQALFGENAFPIAAFVDRPRHPEKRKSRRFSDRDKDIRELLLRRPSSAGDIAASLVIPRADVDSSLRALLAAGVVEARQRGDKVFFHVIGDNPGLTTKT